MKVMNEVNEVNEGQHGGTGSCPPCRLKKKKCIRPNPTGPCESCKQVADLNMQSPTFPSKAIEGLFVAILGSYPKPQAISDAALLNSGLPLPPSMQYDPGSSDLMEASDTAISKTFGIPLSSTFGISEHSTDPITKASLIDAYLSCLVSAGSPSVSSQVTFCGEGDPINLKLLIPTLVSRIRAHIDEFLSKPPPNNKSDSNVYAAEGITWQQVTALRVSLKHLKQGHLLKSARADPTNPLVLWFTSVENQLHKRLAQGCGEYPQWLKAVNGRIHRLAHHYKPLSVSMILHTSQPDDILFPRLPGEYNSAEMIKDEDSATFDLAPQSDDIAFFTQLSGFVGDEAPGTTNSPLWDHPPFQNSYLAYLQDASNQKPSSPVLEVGMENWDTGPDFDGFNPPLDIYGTNYQPSGTLDYTFSFTDATQAEPFGYHDPGYTSTTNQTNSSQETASSMDSMAEPTDSTTFSNNSALNFFQGPFGPPFTRT